MYKYAMRNGQEEASGQMMKGTQVMKEYEHWLRQRS